jgi:hypothetical protein
VLGEWSDPLSGGGLREPVAVLPVGDQHVCVVKEPFDGRGREALGHQLVEPARVNVWADRDRAFLVGGVDDAEQRLGGVGADRQESDVIDLCRYPHSSTSSATWHCPKAPPSSSSRSSPSATNAAA